MFHPIYQRILSEEECEALVREAEQNRLEQEAHYRRTPEWKRLEEEAANIRILSDEECEALEREAIIEASLQNLHQSIPLEWKAALERARQPRTLTPEEVIKYKQRLLTRRPLPQPRVLTPEEVLHYKQRAHKRRTQPETQQGEKSTKLRKTILLRTQKYLWILWANGDVFLCERPS